MLAFEPSLICKERAKSNVKSPIEPVLEPCGLTFAELSRLADEAVIAHLQAGHGDALAVLFDRYHRLILSVALKILRDAGEAEDVLQSVFLEIYKVAGQFDASRGTTKIWLLQYAYHRSMNRRQYLKARNFYSPGQGHADDLQPAERSLRAGGLGPLALPEVRNLVREGLESLNHTERRTLQLTYFEGMSLKEIAEQTGESLGNVRHHYYRGLRHLRLFLSRGYGKTGTKETAEIIGRGIIDVEA
jgi:RNA polymerase sigma-70 factor (ECF subfamily)